MSRDPSLCTSSLIPESDHRGQQSAPVVSGHTPTPWVAVEQKSKDGYSLGWIINHSNGRIGWSSYATAEPNEGEGPPYSIGAANAAFIVRAVNSHEALVKALTDVMTWIDNWSPEFTQDDEWPADRDAASAALASVREVQP